MRYPLDYMKIRTCQFGVYNPTSNIFGHVRVNRVHQGWDLQASPGTLVYAITDGELKSGYHNDYGWWISLKFSHRATTYWAFYGHLGRAGIYFRSY